MIGTFIALIGILYSSYTDLKTGFVPDLLSHSMIVLGAVLVLFFYYNQALIIYGISILIFFLGFLLYIFGQIGGGDVKLFTALSLLIPFYPKTFTLLASSLGIQPTIPGYPFIISVFVFSGVLYMVCIPSFYLKRIFRVKRKIQDFRKKITTGILYSLIFIPFLYFWALFSKVLALIFIPVILTLLIMPFKNDIVKYFFAEKKKVKDLNDDDVLALECIPEKIKKKLGLWRKTFTERELKKIKEKAKREGITEVIVCENMPKYVPFIFISLVFNLIFGDVLLYLMLNIA